MTSGGAVLRDRGGFTLIEVLVALVVLSVAVVAAIQLAGGSLRLLRASGDHAGATLLASAKLAEVPVGPLEVGVTEGEESGYRWTRQIVLESELVPLEPAVARTARLGMARVTVDVRWGTRKHVQMATLRTWTTLP